MRRFLRPFGKMATCAALSLPLLWAGAAGARDWAVVNRSVAPLLDAPGVWGSALERLWPGMRVELLDANAAGGYVRVRHGEVVGYVRPAELLRGFMPEDHFPGTNDRATPEFLASDRDGDGIPDYRDVVLAAREMLGLAFDDASSLRLETAGQVPDGWHASWAGDGVDNDGNGLIDDRDEDVVVCVDLLTRAVEAAGFDLPGAMRRAAEESPERYREGRRTRPAADPFLSRRVRNVLAFLERSPDFEYFAEPNIHSPTEYPKERARPGDLLFFGLTRDLGTRRFKIQHTGICVSADRETGLPVWMVTAIVPRVRFFNLQKGYERFTYCGHARLAPAGSVSPRIPSPSSPIAPREADSPHLTESDAPAGAGPGTGRPSGPGGVSLWADLGHPPVAGTE